MHLVSSLSDLRVMAAFLVIVLPISAFAGWYIGHRTFLARGYAVSPPSSYPGDTTRAGLITLLSLLLAFTFGFTISHAEARKRAQLVEVSAISTAFLRADLLEEPRRSKLRSTLLEYGESRVANKSLRSSEGSAAFLNKSIEIQNRLWPMMIGALSENTAPAIIALNANGITELLDAHDARLAGAAESIPLIVKVMLISCASTSLFVVGNNAALRGRRLTWRSFVFAGMLSAVMIVTLDFERPYSGSIRMDPTSMELMVRDMEAAIVN